MKFSYWLIAVFLLSCIFACRNAATISTEQAANLLYGYQYNDRWITLAVFDEATDFGTYADDYAWAKKQGKWGVINKRGRTLVPFAYDSYRLAGTDNVYFAKQAGKTAVLNLKRRTFISPATYDTAWSVMWSPYNDMTIVGMNGKYGLLSAKCREVLPAVCDTIVWVSGDVWTDPVLYSISGKCGMVNSSGKEIIPLLYDSIAVCVTQADDYGRRHALLNDSVAFFNRHKKPVSVSLGPGVRELYEAQWGGEAMIGNKRR